jgi:hypothetical protein
MSPGGPGAPIHLTNSNLTPGRFYRNIVSLFPCPSTPGSGNPSRMGLCTPYLPYRLRQLAIPAGVDPYHVQAPSSLVSWGPYLVPPMTVDVLCFDATGGVLGAVSPVWRFTIQ